MREFLLKLTEGQVCRSPYQPQPPLGFQDSRLELPTQAKQPRPPQQLLKRFPQRLRRLLIIVEFLRCSQQQHLEQLETQQKAQPP